MTTPTPSYQISPGTVRTIALGPVSNITANQPLGNLVLPQPGQWRLSGIVQVTTVTASSGGTGQLRFWWFTGSVTGQVAGLAIQSVPAGTTPSIDATITTFPSSPAYLSTADTGTTGNWWISFDGIITVNAALTIQVTIAPYAPAVFTVNPSVATAAWITD